MTKEHKNRENPAEENKQHAPDGGEETVTEKEEESVESLKKSLAEANEKYVRLYADFENYKKVAARRKEEILKYANEGILSDILSVLDHLELALQHATNNDAAGKDALAEGVQLTLKELKNVLEKHGLVEIASVGKKFDPNVHHAMSQVQTEDAEENTVVQEFRKGYMLHEKVLRAPLVAVAKQKTAGDDSDIDDNTVDNENK